MLPSRRQFMRRGIAAAMWAGVGGHLWADRPLPVLPAGMSAADWQRVTAIRPALPLPFAQGEKLRYGIGWSLFEVGTADMTVQPTQWAGQDAWEITLEARTNGFADKFYKVRNRTSSWLDATATRTLHYRNEQNEGDRRRDVEVTFDWRDPYAPTAQFTNHLTDDVRPPVPILPGTFDPQGIVFYVRGLTMQAGADLIIPTTNGKECFLSSVDVVEQTERRFRLGRTPVWRLVPDTKDVGGVFRKKANSSLAFWFTADERRLPIRMESEVAVGSFWSELLRAERPGEALWQAPATTPRPPRRGRRR